MNDRIEEDVQVQFQVEHCGCKLAKYVFGSQI